MGETLSREYSGETYSVQCSVKVYSGFRRISGVSSGCPEEDLKSFGVIHAGSSPAPGTIDLQGKTALQGTFFAPAKVAGKPWGNFGQGDRRGFLGVRGRYQGSTAPRSRRFPAPGQASPPLDAAPSWRFTMSPPRQIGQADRQPAPGGAGIAWPMSALWPTGRVSPGGVGGVRGYRPPARQKKSPAAQWVGEIADTNGINPRTIRSAGLGNLSGERARTCWFYPDSSRWPLQPKVSPR